MKLTVKSGKLIGLEVHQDGFKPALSWWFQNSIMIILPQVGTLEGGNLGKLGGGYVDGRC